MAKKQPSLAGQVVRGFFKWLLMILGTLLLIGLATAAIMACYAANYIQTVIIPEAEEVTNALTVVRGSDSESGVDLTSAIYYYDTDSGNWEIEETLYASENREWITYDQIPEQLINATVAIEDKRFWTHNGVDWRRTAGAVVYYVLGQRQEGGSTITQQLIKNLTGNNQTTVKRKVLEIFEALEFDSTHTKEETLEWYLNVIYLGRQCYGVSTAAQRYFGKELSELSLAECASLISITNNPSKYDPVSHPEQNKERQELVLDQMCEQGYITEEERDAAKAETLNILQEAVTSTDEEEEEEQEHCYSWYTDTVISEVIADLEETYGLDSKAASQMIYSGGIHIYSCLDMTVQEQVDSVYTSGELLAGHTSAHWGQDLQSAITVVDNDSGAVVAIAGGVGEKTASRVWNRATQSLRSPGSSLKPLSVYAPAIEMGLVTPDSLIEDSSITLSDGTKFPKSNDGKAPTGDMVTVKYGLQKSLNTIAVQLLQRVSPQYSFNFLQERFGITTLVEDYTGPSGKHYTDLALSPLALGSLTNGVSTYEMAAAYATFARNGIYVEPYVYTVVTDGSGTVILSQDGYPEVGETLSFDSSGNPILDSYYVEGDTVLKSSTVTDMNELLVNAVENGTGKNARIDGVTVAGKTGTTNEDYDRWFAGYTEDYTAVVWTGYDDAETINYDSNPSVEMWRTVMEGILSAASAD